MIAAGDLAAPGRDSQKTKRKSCIYTGCLQLSGDKRLFYIYLYNLLLHLRFEYVNPMAGLVMFIIGLLLIVFGYFEYGVTPVVVGLVLVVYYRKYLWQILGISQP
jgi:hypothetical protein